MKISLARKSGALFGATNERGQEILLDGPADIGGVDGGMRPMELLLVSLAGCSAVDVLHILQKGRETVNDLRISVEGTRKDAVPAVFEKIHLVFSGSGMSQKKLQRAVDLSMEKYCSVTMMLAPTVEITSEARVDDTK